MKPKLHTYNKLDLRSKYPQLAEVFERLIYSDKEKFYTAIENYEGKYPKNGKPRRVSLAFIMDLLEKNGYDIVISAVPETAASSVTGMIRRTV